MAFLIIPMYADDSQVFITFKSDGLEDLEIAWGTLEQCIVDVNNWMLQNNLKLNQDKSELSKKYDRVTPLLIELHWLPVEYRIIFKILLITFKILNGI